MELAGSKEVCTPREAKISRKGAKPQRKDKLGIAAKEHKAAEPQPKRNLTRGHKGED
jgi:hypothetical protein